MCVIHIVFVFEHSIRWISKPSVQSVHCTLYRSYKVYDIRTFIVFDRIYEKGKYLISNILQIPTYIKEDFQYSLTKFSILNRI